MASQKASTGEVFLMRSPIPQMDGQPYYEKQSHQFTQRRWEALCSAIEQAGGTVITVPEHDGSLENSPMYVRDPVLVLPGMDGKPLTLLSKEVTEEYNVDKAKELRQHLVRGKTIALPGKLVGGNLVYDPSRNILFWGVTNYDFVQEDLAKRSRNRGRIMYRHAVDKQRRFEMAEPNVAAIKAAIDNTQLQQAMAREGKPFQICPLFMTDEASKGIYHLDSVFNLLPSGEALVNREALGRTSNLMVEQLVGKENIIPLTEDDVYHCAANFITVGNSLITPHAPPHLKKRYSALGYEVIDPPAMGLREGDWEFSFRAGPRCATQKITPDKGFPEKQVTLPPVSRTK